MFINVAACGVLPVVIVVVMVVVPMVFMTVVDVTVSVLDFDLDIAGMDRHERHQCCHQDRHESHCSRSRPLYDVRKADARGFARRRPRRRDVIPLQWTRVTSRIHTRRRTPLQQQHDTCVLVSGRLVGIVLEAGVLVDEVDPVAVKDRCVRLPVANRRARLIVVDEIVRRARNPTASALVTNVLAGQVVAIVLGVPLNVDLATVPADSHQPATCRAVHDDLQLLCLSQRRGWDIAPARMRRPDAVVDVLDEAIDRG